MVKTGSAIIIENKKILLLKRSTYTDKFPLCWTIPGGREEKGETSEEIVIREVFEETNLIFKLTKLYDHGFFEDREYHRFLGEFSGEIKISDESLDWGRFSYEDSKKLDMAFNYDKIIERLYEEKLIE